MENNIIIDENLAIVHSYLCADGYVSGTAQGQKYKYYHIGLRNTCPALLEDFQSRFATVFQKRPIISKNQDRCKIGNKEIFCWLKATFGSFHSANWTLPACFLTEELLAPWLRTFFDCEGWVEVSGRKNRAIGLESINIRELKKIRRYLKQFFQINSGIHARKGRNTAALAICGKGDLMKFKSAIGFLHPKKNKKLEEAIASFVDYSWHFPETEGALKAFVLRLLRRKITRIKRRIRICSNIRENLLNLSVALLLLFSIESKVSNERFNGAGAKYFELAIQKKESVEKLKTILKTSNAC